MKECCGFVGGRAGSNPTDILRDDDAIDNGSSVDDDEDAATLEASGEAPGGASRPPFELQFHIGGRKRTADGVEQDLVEMACKNPKCNKVLLNRDGHDGWCISCMVMKSSHALPVDLLALMRVPGTLHGALGAFLWALFCVDSLYGGFN